MSLEDRLTAFAEAVGTDVKSILAHQGRPTLKVVSEPAYTVTASDEGSALLLTHENTELTLAAMPKPSSLTVSCADGASITVDGLTLNSGEAGVIARDDSGVFTYAGFHQGYNNTTPVRPAYISVANSLEEVPEYFDGTFLISASTPYAIVNGIKSNNNELFGVMSAGTLASWEEEYDAFDKSLLLNDKGWGEFYLDISRLEDLRVFVEGRTSFVKSKGFDGVLYADVTPYYYTSVGKSFTESQVDAYQELCREIAESFDLKVVVELSQESPQSIIPKYAGALAVQMFRYEETDAIIPWTNLDKPIWAVETADISSWCSTAALYNNLFLARFANNNFAHPPTATCY